MGNEIVIKQVKISFVLFFLLLFSFQINSQSYLITKYSTDNGLPDNRVNDIAQDSLGRIWIAMASGIAMYDGYEWTKFGEKDGVPEVEYTKIKVDEKGIIWVVPIDLFINPLISYSEKNWEKWNLSELTKSNRSNIISIDIKYIGKDPEIYLASSYHGLFLVTRNESFHFTVEVQNKDIKKMVELGWIKP